MLENIKLDIIYYRTPKDFEMEFNLCGCCRMRLLNSAADDIKSLINCMKLAVARSRIIILCGEISGENNLFDIVSKAIGRENEEIDNSLYGISVPGTTQLMKNSIPLISKAGVLCGCVVEQGPQSIIILSTEKQQRKEIMHDLVHPYISALSRIDAVQENDGDAMENTDTKPDAEEAVQAQPEAEAPAPAEPEIQPVSDEITHEGQLTPVQEEDKLANIEPEPEKTVSSKAEISEDDYTADMLLGTEEEDYQADKNFGYSAEDFPLIHTPTDTTPRDRTRRRSKHSKRKEKSPILLILICLLLCLLGILAYFLVLKPMIAGISISENFRQLIPFLSRR